MSRPISRLRFDLAVKCSCASALIVMLTACSGSGSSTTAQGPGISNVSGSYVFQASGTNSTDGDYSVLGSFVADGKGNITSAVADYNLGSGIDQNVPLTGTYTVANGTTTINLTDGGSVKDSFTAAIVSTGSTSLINFDGSGSGTLYAQTTSGFTTPGTYSFSITGEGQGTITGSGQFVAGSTGTFTGGTYTYTDAQTPQNYSAVTGFLAAPLTSGRGVAALEGSNLAYYVVGPNQILMLGLNDQNLLYIPATKQ
jgi:hypothetical protein